ncbi:uncharacterized protein LOC131650613 [Vicia villosa]|uniref:uncharacterized protein LOC131650613 n=1 Tax=Vicia villosa TaxID=3911 RepID=UPI00273CD563|nr:uncharacterized protein LOC131650613 [Vicia villosa]
MARPIEEVKDINESKDLWKIAVRCKHLWSVTSSSNKEHIEMVLVDSKRDLIQAIVPTYLVSKFKSELESGTSYIMQNFKVGKNDFAFKSTNHSYKLVFCGSTSVKKADFPDIPLYYLNIIGLDSIVEGKFQSNVLVDILGGVTDISQTQVTGDSSKNRIVFSIVDASKTVVQCTLWRQLAVQLYEYYKNNKEDPNIVIVLINSRVKEAQALVTFPSMSCDSEGFPVSVSNTWNGTKLLINDIRIDEVKNLKERLGVDLSFLSSSSVQVEATQNSFYSDYDKFETTCVTVATLDKFEAGQMGWFYDGCVECTRSVTVKDGKMKCYKEHISSELVPQYKLDVTAVDGKSKTKFVFWDTDCVKLIGKSTLQIKMDLIQSGDYDPLEIPYELDSILKKELAIRAVFQPKNRRLLSLASKMMKIPEPISASA